MSEIDSYIDIKNCTKAKDSNYSTKEIVIEHPKLKIDTPFKILEGRHINYDVATILSETISLPIYECHKYVSQARSWEKLNYLLTIAERDKIRGLDDWFGIRKRLWDNSLNVISLVFSRNPFKEMKWRSQKNIIVPALDSESFDTLLDYVHTASRALILVPDIRMEYDKVMTLPHYLNYIDYCVKILSEFNKKSIFVPVQIDFSQKRLKTILEHYKKNGYTNIWVNFKAQQVGSTYFSRVRTFLRLLEQTLGIENVVLYYSHIKKEVNPNIKDERVPSSDILTQFLAADFIGINREPPRFFQMSDDKMQELVMKGGFGSLKEYQHAQKLNRTRIFDSESYYYYNIDIYPHPLPITKKLLLEKSQINKLTNSTLIFNEVEKTKQYVLDNKLIKPYLKTKEAISSNNRLLEGIITERSKSSQSKMLDFLNF